MLLAVATRGVGADSAVGPAPAPAPPVAAPDTRVTSPDMPAGAARSTPPPETLAPVESWLMFGALYVKTCADGTLRSLAETEAETSRMYEEVRVLAEEHPERRDLVDAADRQRRGIYERYPMLEGLEGRWWYQPCRYF